MLTIDGLPSLRLLMRKACFNPIFHAWQQLRLHGPRSMLVTAHDGVYPVLVDGLPGSGLFLLACRAFLDI